jgi:hypothetical protein
MFKSRMQATTIDADQGFAAMDYVRFAVRPRHKRTSSSCFSGHEVENFTLDPGSTKLCCDKSRRQKIALTGHQRSPAVCAVAADNHARQSIVLNGHDGRF